VTENELIIATFPSHVKAFLSRGSDFKSLASAPEAVAAFKGEKGPVMFAYQDTPELLKLAYPIVQIVGQLICGEAQRSGVDLDISILPSAPVIARHTRPGMMTVTKTSAGIEMVSRQTLPVGGGLLPMAIPMATFWRMAALSGPVRDFEAVPDPINPGPNDGDAEALPEPAIPPPR
jgi:hypothetical protein